MCVKFVSPRPLTSVESMVLGMLLGAEFPGADVLREQARSAVAIGRCDCGCPSVSLEVSAEVPAAGGFSSQLAPAEGVVSAAGQEGEGEIIFVRRRWPAQLSGVRQLR